ncbi:MAG: class I adenylate-forming enzyme family protein [Pseudomonadota bacterium]
MTDLSRIAAHDAPADRLALLFEGLEGERATFTYAELDATVDALAAALAAVMGARSLAPGSRIALLAGNRPEHFIAYLAAMRAGYVAVPLNHKLGDEALAHALALSGAELVFVDDACAQRVGGSVATLGFDDPGPDGYRAALKRHRGDGVAVPIDAAQDAVIMFTSGSTGLPKGVPLTHGGYGWAMRQFAGLRETLAGRAALIAAPLFHMNAQFHVQATLQAAGTAVLMARFDARRFLDLIGEHEVARVTGVPTMLALAVAELEVGYRARLDSVSAVAMGSAPFSASLLERVQRWFPAAVVSNGYGTTEAGPGVFGLHPDGRPTPPLSLGYPLEEAQVKLVGPEAPERGVLWVRNPMLTRGYLDDAAQTAKSFRDGWYVTNDVMSCDEDGFYFFDGRADDMFVCAGENIFPAEVERLLLRHSAVREAAVVPVPDEVKGALPVAFVVASSAVDEAGLRQFALDHGPAYAHPRAVYFTDALPLAGTKKVDRRALQAEALRSFRR